MIDGDGAEKFEKKWTDLLDEVDQEMDGSEQFKVLHRATAQKQNYVGFSNTNAYRFYGRRRLRYRFNWSSKPSWKQINTDNNKLTNKMIND